MTTALFLALVGSAAAEEHAGFQATMLVDTSASMSDTPVVDLAEDALMTWQTMRTLVPGGRRDRFATLTFADRAEEAVPASFPDTLEGVFAKRVRFEGGTDVQAALDLADRMRVQTRHHLFLMTDASPRTFDALADVPGDTAVHTIAPRPMVPADGARLRALSHQTGGIHAQGTSDAELQVASTLALQRSLNRTPWHVAGVFDLTDGQERRTAVPETAEALVVLAFGDAGSTVKLTAQPPNALGDPLQAGSDDGAARVAADSPSTDLGGIWTVSASSDSDGPVWGVVLADLPALASDLTVLTDNVLAGQPLELEIDLTMRGQVIDADDVKMQVQIWTPTEGMGERLSAFAEPPVVDDEDPGSDAATMLAQLLEDRWDALSWSPESVDAVPQRDGRYAATFTPPVAGHYLVDVQIAGTTEDTGDFSFHHRQSVYAQVLPTMQDTWVQADPGRVEVVPQAAGERLGPGYEGALWLDIDGQDPVRFADQFDGRYLAELDDGGSLPSGTVWFVPPGSESGAAGIVLGELGEGADTGNGGETVPVGCSTSGPTGLLGAAWLLVFGLRRRRA